MGSHSSTFALRPEKRIAHRKHCRPPKRYRQAKQPVFTACPTAAAARATYQISNSNSDADSDADTVVDESLPPSQYNSYSLANGEEFTCLFDLLTWMQQHQDAGTLSDADRLVHFLPGMAYDKRGVTTVLSQFHNTTIHTMDGQSKLSSKLAAKIIANKQHSVFTVISVARARCKHRGRTTNEAIQFGVSNGSLNVHCDDDALLTE